MKSRNLACIGEKSGHTAGWLTTFNDLVTLLMVFFVLLFTMGSTDKNLMKEVQNALQSGLGALSAGAKVSVALKESQRLSDLGDPLSQGQGETTPRGADSPADSLDEALAELTAAPGINVKYENDKIRIAFEDALLFDLGKADINAGGLALLENMAALIQKNSWAVRVEGHTDNIPIHTLRFPSNWDLSTARALSVVKFLIGVGKIDPTRLSAVGYGETRPLVANDSPAMRARNRRVEIVLEMEDKK